jgi:hypothetical protein
MRAWRVSVPGTHQQQKKKRRFVMEELSVLIESLINTLIGLTVLIMLFSIGLGMTFQQVTVLWRKPGKLAKSLLAAVVLAPFVSYIVLYVAGLIITVPEEVFVGVMLLSAASGSALAPKLAEKVGADIGESTSLMVTLAIMTIVSAPVVVAVTMHHRTADQALQQPPECDHHPDHRQRHRCHPGLWSGCLGDDAAVERYLRIDRPPVGRPFAARPHHAGGIHRATQWRDRHVGGRSSHA